MNTENVELWKKISEKMCEAAQIAEKMNINANEQTYDLQKETVDKVKKYANFSAILSSYLTTQPEQEH